MHRLFKNIKKAAQADVSIYISGETGVGRELVARAIHAESKRAELPFVAMNVANFSSDLIESQLFGHKKGSFTGASDDRKGYFEQANKGTIFLDEIGDMPLAAQTKILRALQEGEIQRVGGTEVIKVDVRILAATNKSMEAMVKENTFREDLYYRLNVVRILMPALRQRKEDIPLLINFMLQNLAKKNRSVANAISEEALNLLVEYSWQGNVRELENVVHRSAVLAQGDTILPKDLPEEINPAGPEQSQDKTTEEKPASKIANTCDSELDFEAFYNELCRLTDSKDILKKLEVELIKQAIAANNGVVTKAAKVLGMTANTLKKRIAQFKIQ